MNPLLSSQNLFVLTTINPRKPDDPNLVVINEFEGFYDYVENEMAVNIFGPKDRPNEDRIRFARNLLIKLIGKEEFLRLRDLFQNSGSQLHGIQSFTNLDSTERIIFKLIAKGYKQIEIAELLDFTCRRVRLHRNQIFEKMNFAKKADLLEYANKNKLI
jgi:DNA-binding NarL/FixJ family response regulator